MIDQERLGEILRALRGDVPQQVVADGSGITQQVLSRLERGVTEDPSFSTLVLLGQFYGLTPNDIAVMAGLMAVPGSEYDLFPPDVAHSIERIYAYTLQLTSPVRQRRLAAQLDIIYELSRREYDHDKEIASTNLPDYIRRRLLSTGGVAEDEVPEVRRVVRRQD